MRASLAFPALAALLLAALAVAAPTAAAAPATAAPDSPGALAAIGRQIFFDTSLSASGQLACASCHSPTDAYGPPGGGAAPRGGARLDRPPLRTVPSLRYLDRTPRFTRHYYLERGDEVQDEGPAGGFMRDGRADSLHAQALIPWLDADEMANESVGALARRLRHAHASQLEALFGPDVFDHSRRAVDAAALALERFELEDPSFHPYSSRYDAFLAGRGLLSAQELRGLALFADPRKGNCAECHPHTRGAGGRGPDFSDFAFHALGVPRNSALVANADRSFRDLGLCGPLRRDLRGERGLCGYFKTPTLRNTARRRSYFHNGRFTTLEQVLQFYAARDSAPQRWYPAIAGIVQRFDDLPRLDRANVDSSDAPFGRRPGQAQALSAEEIEDLAAFLRTLEDAD